MLLSCFYASLLVIILTCISVYKKRKRFNEAVRIMMIININSSMENMAKSVHLAYSNVLNSQKIFHTKAIAERK